MRMIPDAERVFEPDPAMPAGAVPIFGEFQDRFARWLKDKIAWAILPAPIGIALFFAHVGLAAPVALVVVSTIRTVSSARAAWRFLLPKRLKRLTFRRVDCAPETLNVSGTGRYVRMYGTARGTSYGYSLYEFGVYA